MQERYLGDSHDFLKYALLRHVARELGVTVGVNWYLTRPEEVDRAGNNDGQKRHHLNGGIWRDIDPALYDTIARFDDPALRTIGNVEALGVLPKGTVYFDEPVPRLNRSFWFARSQAELGSADLIFLDPDNGFEVASMGSRTAPKYALYAEAAEYLAAGKSVIAIQFARQCDPVQRANDIRQTLASRCSMGDDIPVIRGRVAPNILFFGLACDQHATDMHDAFANFVARCPKADLVPTSVAA